MKKFFRKAVGCLLTAGLVATLLVLPGDRSAARPPAPEIAVAPIIDTICKQNAFCNGWIDNCLALPLPGTCSICVTNGVPANYCLEDVNWACVIPNPAVGVVCANKFAGLCVPNIQGGGFDCVQIPLLPAIGTCGLQNCTRSIWIGGGGGGGGVGGEGGVGDTPAP